MIICDIMCFVRHYVHLHNTLHFKNINFAYHISSFFQVSRFTPPTNVMPREHKKKPGTKSYKVHASEVIENALKDIHDGLSIREAALKYNISKSVLGRRIREKQTLKHDG